MIFLMKSNEGLDLGPMLKPKKIVKSPMVWRNEKSVVFDWGPLLTFRGAIKYFP